MDTAAKLSAYDAALALLVGGGYAAGTAVGLLSIVTASSMHGGMPGAEDAGHEDIHSGTVAGAAQDQPDGLASSRDG